MELLLELRSGIARKTSVQEGVDSRFLINSLAHYIGEQYYTTEVTARGNFLLALLTNGEILSS